MVRSALVVRRAEGGRVTRGSAFASAPERGDDSMGWAARRAMGPAFP